MKRPSKVILAALAAFAVAAFAFAPSALAANAHFIDNQPNAGDPSCTWDGTSNFITCSFKIAGLGNVSQVKASVEVTRTCTTQSGSNSPPGQLRSRPTTLQVENGQTVGDTATFTFKKLACPGSQTTDLGDAQFFVNNKLVSGGPVPIYLV